MMKEEEGEKKVLLVLDPGASCGYCIIHVDVVKREGKIKSSGFFDVDTSSPFVGDWCIDLMKRLDIFEKNEGPFEEVGVEDYFFSSKFKQGANINPAYRTAIHIWCRQREKHYEVLNISAWKVFVCGRTTPSREQKARWGAGPSKKIVVVEGLRERFGIFFPKFSISTKTNRKIIFRYDIADAVGLALYMSFLRFNCNSFTQDESIKPKSKEEILDFSEIQKKTKKQ